jgi:hypothetical protein
MRRSQLQTFDDIQLIRTDLVRKGQHGRQHSDYDDNDDRQDYRGHNPGNPSILDAHRLPLA